MDPLTLPVGTLAQSFDALYAEDSIERAIGIVRDAPSRVAPVTEDGRYIGSVTERSLLKALGEGTDLNLPCSSIVEALPTISASATGAEALRLLSDTNASLVVVLNPDSEPVGLLAASDLFRRTIRHPVPPLIGGMATPFGVYLTCGTASGGASHWALVATGAAMAVLLLSANVVTNLILGLAPDNAFLGQLGTPISLILFLLGMRILPLSGTHAAEHMVVHALERGETLIPSVVRRMPRVHPRCGTNLAVGLMMFLGLSSWNLGLPNEVKDMQVLFAALISLMSFRTLGGWVQFFVTTKPPTQKQIQSGITAAEQLLAAYGRTRRNKSSFWTRLYNMGFLHVIAGSSAVVLLAHYLSLWLDMPLGL